jgi:hypothetical protein
MFERFTDRARRVVVLAQEEARLLQHNFIGTEHILLGLIHEGEGVAAKSLESLGISLEAVRVRVEEIVGHGGQASAAHIPFTPRAKKVLELSLREAMQLGHNYIGTEHILLGLIREGEGVAAQVLVNLGADLSRVRRQVIQLLSGYPGEQSASPEPREPRFPVRARCGFCGTPSPECGTLFTGVSGALICERCLRIGATTAASPTLRVHPAAGPAASIEDLEARYEPTGPPPDDEDAARDAITYAFTHVTERTTDGSGLVNVQGGENLGPAADEMDARFGALAAHTETVIDHVKFLNRTEAVVWTTTLIEGRPIVNAFRLREGRAVLDAGKWKLTRETLVEIFAIPGIACPPPPGPGDDTP